MAVRVPVYNGSGLKIVGYADWLDDGPAKMIRPFTTTAGTILAFGSTLNVTDMTVNSSNQIVITADEGTLLIPYGHSVPCAFPDSAESVDVGTITDEFSTFIGTQTAKVTMATGGGTTSFTI